MQRFCLCKGMFLPLLYLSRRRSFAIILYWSSFVAPPTFWLCSFVNVDTNLILCQLFRFMLKSKLDAFQSSFISSKSGKGKYSKSGIVAGRLQILGVRGRFRDPKNLWGMEELYPWRSKDILHGGVSARQGKLNC